MFLQPGVVGERRGVTLITINTGQVSYVIPTLTLLHASAIKSFDNRPLNVMDHVPAVPQSQPLPQNPFHSHNDPDLHDAYRQCLASEHDAESDLELMYARCLGYFLTQLSSPRARHFVAEDIDLCKGDIKSFNDLAELYINHIIRLCESTSSNVRRSWQS